MRTTITLEKDVAARLDRLRKTRPFKDLVNDALRVGLDEIESASSKDYGSYSITPVDGRPRRTDLDNIAEVIAEVEGDDFR
jgi:metal-responsive CopG/Arc/MetJ family transcriptional regulator